MSIPAGGFRFVPRKISPTSSGSRLPGLDLLRGIAVLLVLGRHMWDVPPDVQHPLGRVLEVWQRGGWVGVDLFFVLSGFLVSGLLFSEYKQFGTVSPGRFLLRRGLKIYPAFYVFLAGTACMPFLSHSRSKTGLLCESLFVTN